ncbi:serine O-acetyltransferase [Salegentibacter mishustinae]|uniref:serine O-acetyltransferase n=1 Tax=Salegentibacter mishustinae TaxID=270918 RepID=UPI002492F1E9|nr:serine acetyltransferase [Salegentibacter mishustinae]
MLKKFKTDLDKYRRYSNNSVIILLVSQQGLWALFVYRINNSIYKRRIPVILKRPLLLIGLFFQKMIEIITGISLPYSAEIGSSCYIGHFGGIIINAKAIIGRNCNISQGVTIGVSGRGSNRGVPIIGDSVYIGVNAVLAGKIEIGDQVVVAANSLVTRSVPSKKTVMGVPAEVVSENTSNFYI